MKIEIKPEIGIIVCSSKKRLLSYGVKWIIDVEHNFLQSFYLVMANFNVPVYYILCYVKLTGLCDKSA